MNVNEAAALCEMLHSARHLLGQLGELELGSGRRLGLTRVAGRAHMGLQAGCIALQAGSIGLQARHT